MLKNLFGSVRRPPAADALRATDPERWEASLLERVREMSPSDPLIGAKIGGKELASRLIEAMKSDHGVHVESLMCAAGALAGYSCQAAVRAKNRSQGIDEFAGLTVASTKDGKTFLFGDPINKYVAEGELSVWSIAAGGAQACGCTSFVDVNDIFAHVAKTVGAADFGVPRVPDGHPVHEQPFAYLVRLWPLFFPMINRFCPQPEHWSVAFSLSIQELLLQTKAALDPCVALRVVMESAIQCQRSS